MRRGSRIKIMTLVLLAATGLLSVARARARYAGAQTPGTESLSRLLRAAAVVSSQHDESWKAPPEAKNLKNPTPPTAENLATARAIYMDKCQKCHGDKGLGDGPEADMYDPQPASLADAHMMSHMSDGEIYWKITEGRKPMPSFKKDLSDEQRWQLVNFLRTLSTTAGHAGDQRQLLLSWFSCSGC